VHASRVSLEGRQQSNERAALQIVRNEEARDKDCTNPLQRRTPQREEIVRGKARRVCQKPPPPQQRVQTSVAEAPALVSKARSLSRRAMSSGRRVR